MAKIRRHARVPKRVSGLAPTQRVATLEAIQEVSSLSAPKRPEMSLAVLGENFDRGCSSSYLLRQLLAANKVTIWPIF